MINAYIPWSLEDSPVAQPGYSAGNYRGAESKAMAATIMRYSGAPASEGILTNYATVERFYPIATYTRNNLSLSKVPYALIGF